MEFCSSISSKSAPFFIDVNPGTNDEVNECTNNVARRVMEQGGKEILGWKIWEWYGLMIEAEFHVVWQSADGTLHDITPCLSESDRVLFLPDVSLRYEGKQISNIRRPLVKDPRVKEFIKVNEAIFGLMNRGEREFQHGVITLSGKEANEKRSLDLRSAQLLFNIQKSTPSRNEYCRCGSGKKSKRCCYQ